MRILLTEYPKSGGTWVTSLLGSALQLPKRDIYINDDYRRIELSRHPWYEGASSYGLPESCVIKSHELPGSPLTNFPAQVVHLVRDGRDVAVSKFYFERDFCVRNGISDRFDTPFDQYVGQVAHEWQAYVSAWLATDAILCRYEDFLRDPAHALGALLAELGLNVSQECILAAVAENTAERLSRSLDQAYAHNTFVRKAVAGDWHNHFSPEHALIFTELAGDTLERLGYELAPVAPTPAAPTKEQPVPTTRCWCGNEQLEPFSPAYLRCPVCQTLVVTVLPADELKTVRDDEHDFYGRSYWFSHQEDDLNQPNLLQRARADLPERVCHWMRALLTYKLPPATALELGSAHGGLVAMLRWAGFDAAGLEMSPWVVDFARRSFAVPMLQGPLEQQQLAPASLDLVVLCDVLEHLFDPAGTLAHCRDLLKSDGILLIQTPRYIPERSFDALVETSDPFLIQLRHEQHIYLFSEASAAELLRRLGFAHIAFLPAIFAHYDMFLVASRAPLVEQSPEAIAQALSASPSGRMVLALLDLRQSQQEFAHSLSASESERHTLGAAYRTLETERIPELERRLTASEADRAARLAVIERQGVELSRIPALEAQLAASEADRAARLELIERQGVELSRIPALEAQLAASEADRAARLELIERQGVELSRIPDLEARLVASEADRAARLAVIERQGAEIGRLQSEHNALQERLARLNQDARAALTFLRQSRLSAGLLRLKRWRWLQTTLASIASLSTPQNDAAPAPPASLTLRAYKDEIDRFNRSQPNAQLLDAIRAYNHTMIESLNQQHPLRDKSLLDIGASPHGYALERALQLGAREYLGIGLDVEQPVAVQGPNGIGCLRAADATRLDLPDNSFDLVLSISTFEHINDLPAALAEIARVLKPDGAALISFEPIWTCSYGHHLHHLGPVAGLMPDWAHLVWDQQTMLRELAPRWPADAPLTLAEAAHWVYESNALNRVGIAQLRDLFANAPLTVDWLAPIPDSPRDPARLRAIAAQTGIPQEDLMIKGLSVMLRKLMGDEKAAPAPTMAATAAPVAAADEQAFAQIREPKAWKTVAYNPALIDSLLDQLRGQGFRVEDLTLDPAAYKSYFDAAGYPSRFPHYYAFNLPEKSLEHFVAAQLLGLGPDDVYIDIASEHSPVPQIYAEQFGCKTYKQDLAYPPGLNGDKIGGDAAAMPLPDGFASTMALHCSFEHFEGDADMRFMRETRRVLRPGGRLCILPLYLNHEFTNQAGPASAIKGKVEFDQGATVYAKPGWRHGFARYYDPAHLAGRIKANAAGLDLVIYHVTNARAIDPSCYLRFALLATKPA